MDAPRVDQGGGYVGKSVLRSGNYTLLAGKARFMDDVLTKKSTLHAAILRSPHAHAEIVAIDASACLARPYVVTVITGREMREFTDPLKLAADTPVEYRCLTVNRVRFVGEPVAIDPVPRHNLVRPIDCPLELH